MAKKVKGPSKLPEWESALSKPLDYENSMLLRKGTLKRKEYNGALFGRIADYVINAFNSEMGAINRAEDSEIVFALDRFTAALGRINFYRELDFLPNKAKITESLTEATNGLIKNLTDKYGENYADIVYAIGTLRRKIEELL